MISDIANKIYPTLPVWAQNLCIIAYGYNWHQRRFGGVFQEELKKFKERESYTAKQWEIYQTVELRKLLTHAYTTVPYYRENYHKAGFSKDDFENFELEDLKKLPYLEKEDLRKFSKSSLLSTKREKGGQFFSSSGSTGTPTQILFSHPFHQRWSAAFEARIRNWAGLNRFESRGMIGGRNVVPNNQINPPFYRRNITENQVYFSINHLSRKNAKYYVEGINRHELKYMTGYAISNFLLAQYIIELELDCIPLKAVITSSEKLTLKMKETFRKAYQCRTYDSWSGIEACALISECEHGTLHSSPDVGIIEIINDNSLSVSEGESGEIVCTGLLNWDQPLIRYKIGDIVELGSKQLCMCGRHFTKINSIIGRIDDIVTLKDGRQLSSFNRFFAEIQGIAEAQVIQKSLDEFKVKIVPTDEYSEHTIKSINEVFEKRIGKITLEFENVDRIPRNKNGKFKAVISELNNTN